ncbi:MAG TPA: FliH/SctL family protein [Tepidisphaeraceae bacterium]|nr:FliH/SctL family protein [Tepidisphaeraceae bacterium]
MGLIKSPNLPTSASPFSLADIEKAARGVLLRARAQAEQLLAAAQAEAQQLKAHAKEQGLAEAQHEGFALGSQQGRAAGEQQALADMREQLQQAFAALSQAAQELNTRRLELETGALQDVVKLAISIGRKVTKRQGIIDPQVLAENLHEAMKLVVQQSDLRIAIHPSQRKTLDETLPKFSLTWPALKHAEIIEDAKVAPGGCRLLTRGGQIDGDLDVQLDHVIADLLPDTREGMA